MARASQALGREATTMDPPTETAAWKKHTLKKTESRNLSEEKFRHSRPSDLAHYATRHTGHEESSCPEPLHGVFGDSVSGKTNGDIATAKRHYKLFQPTGRENRIESMERVQEEAEEFGRIACRARRLSNSSFNQRMTNRSMHGFPVTLGQRPGSKHRRTNSASPAETRDGEPWSKAARSLSDPLTTARHVTQRSAGARNHSRPGRMDPKIVPKISTHLLTTRSRGSQSDNSFLLSKMRDREPFLRRKRTTSEPSSRNVYSGRPGKVTLGSGNLSLHREQRIPALKEALPRLNRNARVRPVSPLPKKASEAQDVISLGKKKLEPPIHFPLPRSSPRLAQRRKEATSLKWSAQSLQKQGGKKRKRSIELDPFGSNISRRLRSSTRHNTGIEKDEPPNGRHIPSRSKATKATGEDAVAHRTENERLVKIPDDTDMATELRRYNQWPGTD